MQRDPLSHKGENGIVAIIGGSTFMHGAPLMSALSAEASGVDLVFVCLPASHADVARQTSLNFQVHPFHGDDLEEKDMEMLTELLATMDAVVIGPGLSREKKPLEVLRALIESCTCPMVLDASALQPWTLDAVKGKTAVLTPHLGEAERMGMHPESIDAIAEEYGQVIHLKGVIDRIAYPDGSIREGKGGNAGLTVGGTGDALAGLIAGLMAQKFSREEACVLASKVIKQAAQEIALTQGTRFTARQVIHQFQGILKDCE